MLVLVMGGSGSGKSEYAERLLSKKWDRGIPRYYIATMEPYGMEGQERVRRHQKLRQGKGFQTIERYRNVSAVSLPGRGDILLEDLSNLMANECFGNQEIPAVNLCIPEAKMQLVDRMEAEIAALSQRCENLVVVTNEIFSDGIFVEESTRNYIEAFGLLNRRLAAHADIVVEVVCAIPVYRKGGWYV